MGEVKQFPANVKADGTRKRGPRNKDGESWKTGSSQRRELMEEYVEWLVTPKSEREPKTKQDMAVLLGVVPRTLNYYDNDPWVQKQVANRTKSLIKVTRAADVLNALYVTATDVGNSRSVSAAKVLLDYVDGAVEELTADDLVEMGPAELAELLADVHDLILEEGE